MINELTTKETPIVRVKEGQSDVKYYLKAISKKLEKNYVEPKDKTVPEDLVDAKVINDDGQDLTISMCQKGPTGAACYPGG